MFTKFSNNNNSFELYIISISINYIILNDIKIRILSSINQSVYIINNNIFIF